MLDKLTQNILATIAYYDGLDYPMTSFEIWKNLIRTDYYDSNNQQMEITLEDVISQLQSKEIFAYIHQENGFYFLKSRNQLISKRINANKIAAGKIKRLYNLVKVLRFVPFIKMIGITGKLAMKNAHNKSDWDLLIVVKHGKIWTGRTVITFLIHALGKRRYANKVNDRACLNYFISDESLEVITKDLFSANEYMFLYPIYGWETYVRFQIKNKWIKNMKPTYTLSELPPLKLIEDSSFSKAVKEIAEKMLAPNFIEKFLKKIERKRIMKNPKTHQEGSLIYANDDALVFLPSPHGPKIFEQFKEKVQQLEL